MAKPEKSAEPLVKVIVLTTVQYDRKQIPRNSVVDLPESIVVDLERRGAVRRSAAPTSTPQAKAPGVTVQGAIGGVTRQRPLPDDGE